VQTNEIIIIVGGGACGLIAANELLNHGKKVILLEAKNRLGGRIQTLYEGNPAIAIEAGAEFIHGKLPVTFGLLKEYKLKVQETGGKMVYADKTNYQDYDQDNWVKLMQKMAELKIDLPLSEFLLTYFPGDRYSGFRKSVEGFANGFDLASPDLASTFSLRDEWSKEDEEQYRMCGGYKKLIDALHNDCASKGCEIHRSEIVKKIQWKKNEVIVLTEKGNVFYGAKALITIPAGVWHSDPNSIRFEPAISATIEAFNKIGFGSVIKIILHFREAFWEKKYKNLGFLITDEFIPTWWTQAPEKNNMVTGWVGTGLAKKLKGKSADELSGIALQFLGSAFEIDINHLKDMLISSYVFNWDDDIFFRGGYSFSMIESPSARQFLREPVADTLFFAGEALYEGIMQGSVEAALWSGLDSSRKIIG